MTTQESGDRGPILASVIIPAYNEEAVIGRCLQALRSEPLGESLEIVVAANACTDRTVEVARSFSGLTVLDLPDPGKPGALNAADQVADVFPRIYLDADVELRQGALPAMIRALDCPQARLATPALVVQTDGCSRAVRAFYRVFVRLPFARESLVGRGVYALNAAGRARFARFPTAQGDDLFVGRHFGPLERTTTAGISLVRPPQTTRALLSVLTRVHRGNAALADPTDESHSGAPDLSRSTRSTVRALALLARERPTLAADIAVYAALTALARARARDRTEIAPTWNRDLTTR